MGAPASSENNRGLIVIEGGKHRRGIWGIFVTYTMQREGGAVFCLSSDSWVKKNVTDTCLLRCVSNVTGLSLLTSCVKWWFKWTRSCTFCKISPRSQGNRGRQSQVVTQEREWDTVSHVCMLPRWTQTKCTSSSEHCQIKRNNLMKILHSRMWPAGSHSS